MPPLAARLRVLHAVPDLQFGGLQRLVTQMARLTDAARFDVQVLVFGEVSSLADELRRAGRMHHAVPQSRWSMVRPRNLARQIREIGPDILHSHSGVWYKASLAARMAGVPWLVHTDHGRLVPDPWEARLVDHLASRRTDVVVAVSEPLAARLRASVVAHPDRVRVVINGVDTDALRPGGAEDLRAVLGVPRDAPVIGSVGRLETIKGYDLMIEAFGLLSGTGLAPEPYLVIAGDGAERARLESRARALGVADRVRFLGWRGDTPRLLATFDLFALTSRSEGTSVSLLEAMSAGVCPVVTAVGGNADVLGPELRHRLVPLAEPAAIAACWAEALRDPAGRARDADLCRDRAVQRFSLGSMVAHYESLYDAGMSRRREPPPRSGAATG